jgi:hypothetical protein
MLQLHIKIQQSPQQTERNTHKHSFYFLKKRNDLLSRVHYEFLLFKLRLMPLSEKKRKDRFSLLF